MNPAALRVYVVSPPEALVRVWSAPRPSCVNETEAVDGRVHDSVRPSASRAAVHVALCGSVSVRILPDGSRATV